MRSAPLARISTFLTPSGKRTSAGKRTAWERLLVNTVVMVKGFSLGYGISICPKSPPNIAVVDNAIPVGTR